MLVPPRLFCVTDRLDFFKNGVGLIGDFFPTNKALYLLIEKIITDKWGRGLRPFLSR